MLETALVAGILLAVALGVIEFGNAFGVEHTLTSLSREGANLASRGTGMNEVVDVTLENGAEIDLSGHGGVVVSRVVVEDGAAVITERVASDGQEEASRIGGLGDPAIGVEGWELEEGQSIHVVEVIYEYQQITPFGSLVGAAVPGVLYERAVF